MPAPSTELKVMSFNIRYGTADDGENSRPNRREAVLEFLATSGYDIVCLQEVLYDQLLEIRQEAPFLHWVGVGRDDGLLDGEFSAILFDSRVVQSIASETFWLSDTPEVVASTSWGNTLTRICTHGSFELRGRPFEVFNLHVDHESAISRLKSVELLLERIRSRGEHIPTIVTGDFNEGESGPAIEAMVRGGFLDSYRTINPDGPEQATYHNWVGVTLGDRIDYIFVDGSISIVSATIVRENPYRQFLSDHYPVAAFLEL